jgi:vitamin B12 transporter
MVSEALREVPGLVVAQNGSHGSVTSVFFRGAESDHAKVMMDGVEVNQVGGAYDFSGLTMANVERIEVVRGAASALYGSDAMAGVIHVITRRGRGGLRTSLAARGGTYGRAEWLADLMGGDEATSYSVSISRLSSDGILDYNNQSRNTLLEGSIGHRPDERTRLRVLGRYSDRVYHFPTDGSGNLVDENSFSFGEEVTLGVDAARMISDRIELRALVRNYGWSGGTDDRPDNPGDTLGFYGFVSLDDVSRTSAELRGNVALSSSVMASLGMEFEDESQRSFSESSSQWGPSSGESRYSRTNWGYYAHVLAETGGWSGNAGARVEDNEQYGTFATFQAGLAYSLESMGTRVRGSVGSGLKEPTFYEAAATGYVVGNPDLDPERSLVWDVGMEQRLGKGGALATVTWFDQDLEDLIQYTFSPPVPGDPNFFNVARARVRGLELALDLPLGPVDLDLGYTLLDSEVLDAGFDEGAGAVFVEGDPLIRRPRHQAQIRGRWWFGRGSLTAEGRVVGTRSDRDFGGFPAEAVDLRRYTVVNTTLDLRVLEGSGRQPGLSLQLRGENLLDEAYQEIFGFQAPGRAFLIGGRLDFGPGGGG